MGDFHIYREKVARAQYSDRCSKRSTFPNLKTQTQFLRVLVCR